MKITHFNLKLEFENRRAIYEVKTRVQWKLFRVSRHPWLANVGIQVSGFQDFFFKN